ncbi:putative methylglyoxal reductase (NADPH-dependent) [Clavispora lusitaniae]|uniref:Methylglyoxal reductase (NADPH-dependent) n=1 Tax=Clavispora lusitaniae TaxID=36911 RepID=A0AA91T150_CLALS|nr:putative methylglyoxal reductase (NADPH-dependent) [Clavispora lusitaniae]
MSETVFVSGATGFIAQHICKLLLDKGYTVIGSARSEAKGEHLAQLLNSTKFSYVVVPDVQFEGAFDDVLAKNPQISVFLHTASPFHFKATNVEDELLKPAVHGTKNALKSITKHGNNVKRVVITSSYAAISTAESEADPSVVNNEKTWNQITWEESKRDPVSGYRGSKKFAELAGWDFVKEQKPNFIINYVNPSFVFGPQAFDSEVKDNLNTSSEIINNLLKLTPESQIPPTRGGFVDVRDVAKAHLIAFEKPIENERLLMNAGRFCSQDLLDVLNAKFSELKGKIPVGEPGTGHLVNDAMCKIENEHTKSILGFKLIDLETTVYDSVKQILDAKKGSKI